MPHVACLKNLKNLKFQILKTLKIFKKIELQALNHKDIEFLWVKFKI
jgi:hypothetical protein